MRRDQIKRRGPEADDIFADNSEAPIYDPFEADLMQTFFGYQNSERRHHTVDAVGTSSSPQRPPGKICFADLPLDASDRIIHDDHVENNASSSSPLTSEKSEQPARLIHGSRVGKKDNAGLIGFKIRFPGKFHIAEEIYGGFFPSQTVNRNKVQLTQGIDHINGRKLLFGGPEEKQNAANEIYRIAMLARKKAASISSHPYGGDMDLWDLQNNVIVHQDPYEANLMHHFFDDSYATVDSVYYKPNVHDKASSFQFEDASKGKQKGIPLYDYNMMPVASSYVELDRQEAPYMSPYPANSSLGLSRGDPGASSSASSQWMTSYANQMPLLTASSNYELPGIVELKATLPHFFTQIVAIYQSQFKDMAAERAYEDIGLAGNATVGAMLLYGDVMEKYEWAKYVFEEATKLRAQM